MNKKKLERVHRRDSATIDLSGLMDIIFILLIFVMLSVSFQKKFSVMEMDLPENEGIGDEKESDLEISVNAMGKIFLHTEEVSIENLIVEIQKKNPKRIRLNADKKLSYEDFIYITQNIKKAGVEKIDLGLKMK